MVSIGRTVTPFDFMSNTMKEMPVCFFAAGYARQILLLLRLVAEGVDDRADHADAEGERRRRRMHLQLFVEDVMLHRGPPGAAIFLRPVRTAPPLLVQDAPPGDHLVLREMAALHQLLP